jgi:hypothetical protein
MLKDVGISRTDADRKGSKHFWPDRGSAAQLPASPWMSSKK